MKQLVQKYSFVRGPGVQKLGQRGHFDFAGVDRQPQKRRVRPAAARPENRTELRAQTKVLLLLAQSQLICATFNKAKQTFGAMILETAFVTEMLLLEAKCLEKRLHQHLEAAHHQAHARYHNNT